MPKYVITGAVPADTVELKLEPDDDGDPTLWARGPGGEWAALLCFAPDCTVYRRDVDDDQLEEMLHFTDGLIDIE